MDQLDAYLEVLLRRVYSSLYQGYVSTITSVLSPQCSLFLVLPSFSLKWLESQTPSSLLCALVNFHLPAPSQRLWKFCAAQVQLGVQPNVRQTAVQTYRSLEPSSAHFSFPQYSALQISFTSAFPKAYFCILTQLNHCGLLGSLSLCCNLENASRQKPEVIDY